MGRTVSIYLDDEFVDILKRQDKSVSGVVKDALRVYLKSAERKKSFDRVIESAEKIGISEAFKEAEKEWVKNREKDRW
jgi:metal-responsive CopG/Arc/MetJ family transcriptional regulator